MATIFKLLEQILQSGQGRSREFFSGIGTAEKNASIVPAGKRETAKAQQNFAGLGDRMNGNGTRRQGNDSDRARSVKDREELAIRDGEQAKCLYFQRGADRSLRGFRE